MVTPKGSMSTEGETLVKFLSSNVLTSEGSWQTFLAHARQSWPMTPAGLFILQCTGSHSAGISCTTHEFLVQNLCCTITTDSVLANCKTQNAFLFPVHAMFCHYCPLVVKPASTPWCLVHTKTWRDSLPIDMLLSAVWLLHSQVWKFQRDLWITLYVFKKC
jgi:hypothetical protein